jgi:hypothetical protein
MKMSFQQYRPSTSQYAIGILGLLVASISTCIIIAFNYKLYSVSSFDYLMALKVVGPGLILTFVFLPKRMLVISKTSKGLMIHTEYVLAFFKIAFRKKPLPKIDYVCAFSQLQSDSDNEGNANYSYIYDVNAWYGNKHIKLCSQYTPEEAMRVATKIAIYLECDLLNSTDQSNREWIEISHKPEDVQIL